MKLQQASVKEIKRMALGSLILGAVQLAVFLLLYIFNIVNSYYPVIIGTAGGILVTVLSFTVLCFSIQRAADTQDQKLMKSRMQFSYNIRMILQAGWVVGAFFIPFVNVIAAAIPLLYPTVIIIILQKQGKLVTPSENTTKIPFDDDEEDKKETFEV